MRGLVQRPCIRLLVFLYFVFFCRDHDFVVLIWKVPKAISKSKACTAASWMSEFVFILIRDSLKLKWLHVLSVTGHFQMSKLEKLAAT